MSARPSKEWLADELRAEYGVGPSTVPIMERVPVTYATSRGHDMEEYAPPRHLVWDVDIANAVCRIVARGRMVARLVEVDPHAAYMVRVYAVEDPMLAGRLALVFVGEYGMRLWFGSLDSARSILASGNAFNWA